MDDSLEQPSSLSDQIPKPERPEDEDEQSSGDEDGGLDWTKLTPGVARPVIPKRGEKDFEPNAYGGGSEYQLHVLDRARSAMFEALRATRNTSSKSISYGIWCPGIARVHVTVARGIHFTSMGHSVPRPVSPQLDVQKVHKRLELLPEEAIYLVERGAMFCWKENAKLAPDIGMDIQGSPMSVQQAYAEMIGTENLTLEKYQVFAYLKRLGYVVTRTDPPTLSYPAPLPVIVSNRVPKLFQQFRLSMKHLLSRLRKLFAGKFDWWRPFRTASWLHQSKIYAAVFKSLRIMPAGHGIPIKTSIQVQEKNRLSSYKIFYNLYKPSTSFRKTAPPPPDFSVVVINARTTPMPTLHELSSLFNILPELPPPLPRQRQRPPHIPQSIPPAPLHHSKLRSAFSWLFPLPGSPPPPSRSPNPFMALKAGNKTIVIAVVDAGNISFFRFGQGTFLEWPMV